MVTGWSTRLRAVEPTWNLPDDSKALEHRCVGKIAGLDQFLCLKGGQDARRSSHLANSRIEWLDEACQLWIQISSGRRVVVPRLDRCGRG